MQRLERKPRTKRGENGLHRDLVAVAALVYGGAVTGRLGAKLGKLAAEIQRAGRPASAEQQTQLQSLQAGLQRAGRVNAVLVIIAVTAMAIARYL